VDKGIGREMKRSWCVVEKIMASALFFCEQNFQIQQKTLGAFILRYCPFLPNIKELLFLKK